MPHVAFTYAREIPKQKTNQTALYCVESQTGTCVPVFKRFWIETGSPGAPVLSRRTLELGVSERGGSRCFVFEGWGALLELGGAIRSCARPARSAHTSDASGRTRSSEHFREVTPRVLPPLTERPSLLVTLPVWPILRLPHRHGPFRSDYVSREPQQGRQRVSKASHARDVSFLSLSPRCRRRVPGVPSFDLATVLPLHPNRRTSPTADRTAG